mmetsp:Transcript_26390/g.52575  ORF Transcript_26390/g.52575 Transcript_26390/m.52575 type:complete len:90 (-) Transcript_26390:73-342(-)
MAPTADSPIRVLRSGGDQMAGESSFSAPPSSGTSGVRKAEDANRVDGTLPGKGRDAVPDGVYVDRPGWNAEVLFHANTAEMMSGRIETE